MHNSEKRELLGVSEEEAAQDEADAEVPDDIMVGVTLMHAPHCHVC